MTNDIDGFLIVDKPAGLTSRAVVDRARRWFPRGTRLGHAGTLDPLATGVLVLCVGKATRLVEVVQEMPKTYRAGLLLGARSTTDDADGDLTAVAVSRPPEESEVARCLERFVGEVVQVPPAYSAAKVAGRRAYDLARQGAEVSLAPRPVRIFHIQLLHYAYPQLELEIHCGKGTYIRALARDLGELLGCGAYVQTLRRTAIGPFRIADCGLRIADCGLDHQSAIGNRQSAIGNLMPLAAAVGHLPQLCLPKPEIDRLCHGLTVPCPQGARDKGQRAKDKEQRTKDKEVPEFWAAFDEAGNLAALCREVEKDDRLLLQPEKVFLAGDQTSKK